MALVLVVDDDDAVRRALRKLLERANHRVVEAESGTSALAVLAADPGVDVVVSDVIMPGLDGVTFYDHLVARWPHLGRRVIFLTGSAGDPTVHQALETRGVPLIGKLGDLQLVVDAVRLAVLRTS
jgi:CheY-like chemotaxis protein